MSTPKKYSVFVTSATGAQGGALAHQLTSLGWTVHATTRDLTSPAAQSLAAAGVQLTQGDWDDHAALASAIAGCDKLYLCLFPDFRDTEREVRQTQAIVDIAKAAGVKQVIASTSLPVSTLENAPELIAPGSFMEKHIASKKAVEDAVAKGGFEHYTFLRPCFFMANFLKPKVARYPEPGEKGTWTTAMTAETPFPMTDHVNIAAYAAAVFQNPEKFHGRAVGLASETLTPQEAMTALGEATGREMKAVFMTDEEIKENQKNSNVIAISQVFLRYLYKYVDLEEIAKVIQPTSWKEFLEREKEVVKQTYP